MRIALVHSFYSSSRPSGENMVVDSEFKSLQKAGYEVELFAAWTDELEGDQLYPLRAAWRVATGRGNSPLKSINAFRPDILHIHNLFPNFGRRWVEDIDVPVVHTLHNYRPLCANGLLLRAGNICTKCPDGDRWAGVRYACYRRSRFATLPIAVANRKGPMADPLLLRADRLIMLSERQRNIYCAAGVPQDRTVVWPHFLPDELVPRFSASERDGWLFVGRLSHEKGIVQLITRWPGKYRLRVVGEGEQRGEVEKASKEKQIEVLGQVGRDKVLRLMRHSVGLIVPSICYETGCTSYTESLAAGLPVLAFEPNIATDFVRRDNTGWTTTWEDQIVPLLEQAINEADALRSHCRATFDAIGTATAHRQRAAELYNELLKESTRPPRGIRSESRAV